MQVPVPNSLLSPPSTSAAEPKNDLDFSYERRILRELDASKRMVPVVGCNAVCASKGFRST